MIAGCRDIQGLWVLVPGACLLCWPSPASSCTSWCFPACQLLSAHHLFLLACGFGFWFFWASECCLQTTQYLRQFCSSPFEISFIPQVMAAAFFFFFLLELEVSHRDEQGTYAVLSCVISKEICEVSLCSAVVHTLRSCLLFSDVKSCC